MAKTITATGRKIINDEISARELPPVRKTTIRKTASMVNGCGHLNRQLGRVSLVFLLIFSPLCIRQAFLGIWRALQLNSRLINILIVQYRESSALLRSGGLRQYSSARQSDQHFQPSIPD
jgi:hypothetical protein